MLLGCAAQGLVRQVVSIHDYLTLTQPILKNKLTNKQSLNQTHDGESSKRARLDRDGKKRPAQIKEQSEKWICVLSSVGHVENAWRESEQLLKLISENAKTKVWILKTPARNKKKRKLRHWNKQAFDLMSLIQLVELPTAFYLWY